MASVETGGQSSGRGRRAASTDDGSFDLNLAPMLDIIVSIIPMLLMSFAFVNLAMIETTMPIDTQQAIQAANEEVKENLHLSLMPALDHSMTLEFAENEQTQSWKIPATSVGRFDLDQMHQKLDEIKRTHTRLFELTMAPADGLSVDDVVGLIDRARRKDQAEKTYQFTDSKTGKTIETDLMFPEVSFDRSSAGT